MTTAAKSFPWSDAWPRRTLTIGMNADSLGGWFGSVIGAEKMDRDELIKAIRNGPIRVTMNDGSQYDVMSPEVSLVSDLSLHVLYRDEATAKWKTHILSLVCMVRIEELEAAA